MLFSKAMLGEEPVHHREQGPADPSSEKLQVLTRTLQLQRVDTCLIFSLKPSAETPTQLPWEKEVMIGATKYHIKITKRDIE